MMPPPTPPDLPLSRCESRWIVAIFAVLFALNLWSVSVGWFHPNLPGCEFRQTQTAISAFFIQRDHDFSLAYPTPVLGPPWSIPLEFPLYQWTVVGLSNLTHWSLTSCGRAVSTVCFYLCLPALYLLLGSLRLARPHRLIVLAFMLTCPLHIFYARAFLIETMALMFGLWYLVALVRALQQRRWSWLILAIAAGTLVGLVKVTTFFAFLIPAFALSLSWLWAARPARTGGMKSLVRTFGWLAVGHALPFAASIWWVHYSDAIKALNFNGRDMTSAALTHYNFGTGVRFDALIWHQHWDIMTREITLPLTFVLVAGLAVFAARRWWGLLLASLALFFVIQIIFPILYAWHDYYYVAIAFLPMLGFGLVMVEVLRHPRIPKLAAFVLFFLVQGLQAYTYFKNDYQTQKLPGSTIGGLDQVLKVVTQPSDVLICAGDDWSSSIPYYTERRALMIRRGYEADRAFLENALTQMIHQPVTTLILIGEQRNNAYLLELADQFFDIDQQPAFTWLTNTTVYMRRDRTAAARQTIADGRYYGVSLAPITGKAPRTTLAGRTIAYASLAPYYQALFRSMTPRPTAFFSSVGPQLWEENGGASLRYFAHPETKLWFNLSGGTHHLKTAIELVPSSYQNVPFEDSTDGIELVLTVISATGQRTVAHSLRLDPRGQPADRGLHPIDWSFDQPPGGQVELQVNSGPAHNDRRDWTLLNAIDFN